MASRPCSGFSIERRIKLITQIMGSCQYIQQEPIMIIFLKLNKTASIQFSSLH